MIQPLTCYFESMCGNARALAKLVYSQRGHEFKGDNVPDVIIKLLG